MPEATKDNLDVQLRSHMRIGSYMIVTCTVRNSTTRALKKDAICLEIAVDLRGWFLAARGSGWMRLERIALRAGLAP
jgi:hypothetical protein